MKISNADATTNTARRINPRRGPVANSMSVIFTIESMLEFLPLYESG